MRFFVPVFLMGCLLFVSCMVMLPASSFASLMDDYGSVKLQSLDKVSARTLTFEAKVGETVKYGPLYIKIQACRKAPPLEQPESAAFLQIWEIPPETGEAEWIFSGWMFASSPALSAMDHPVYDVWVIDCMGDHVDSAQLDTSKEKEGAAKSD